MLNGRLLADGGMMDPVPIAPTAAARADLTIAVSLSGADPHGREAEPVVADGRRRSRSRSGPTASAAARRSCSTATSSGR